MTTMKGIFDSLVGFYDAIPFNAIAQIAILYALIYGILKAGRGTRFGQALLGSGLFFALIAFISHIFEFDVIMRILQELLGYVVISAIVVFHPEIRRMLATLGSVLFRDRHDVATDGRITPNDFTNAIFRLSEKRLGALFAFERGISLRGYEESATPLDAIISEKLLESIFTEPLPLHDGGAVIRHGRIASAHCTFPISNRDDLATNGMRHRAAVGISEETDALVVVVSEETGRVSIAHNGKLIRYPDTSASSRLAIAKWISKAMPRRRTTLEKIGGWVRKRQHERNLKREARIEAAETAQAEAAHAAAVAREAAAAKNVKAKGEN